MIAPFDPEHLTPSASLNRLLMLSLPGAHIELGITGQPAYAVLSLGARTGDSIARSGAAVAR